MNNTYDSRVVLSVLSLLSSLRDSPYWEQWEDLISVLGEDCETANTAAKLMLSREKEKFLGVRTALIEHEAHYRGKISHGTTNNSS